MHTNTLRLLETSTHPLDTWPLEGNFPPPLSARLQDEFQERINKICGLAPNGKPAVRLIWPADPDESISMKIVDGEKRARYILYSEEYECEMTTEGGLTAVEIVTVDITPPRWMLEEYSEPMDDYLHLTTIAFHDERCCEGRGSIAGHLCNGLYREPAHCDLEDLQRRIRERDASGERVYADQPFTYSETQAALQRIRNWTEIQQRTVKDRYKQAIMDGLMPQSARLFSQDPTVQKWGKYHFLSGHSRSGK